MHLVETSSQRHIFVSEIRNVSNLNRLYVDISICRYFYLLIDRYVCVCVFLQ